MASSLRLRKIYELNCTENLYYKVRRINTRICSKKEAVWKNNICWFVSKINSTLKSQTIIS